MNFNTNFSELVMLADEKIKFWNDEEEFFIESIKVKDLFLKNDILWLVNFLETDIEEFKKDISSYEISSHYDFLIFGLTFGKKRTDLIDLYNLIYSSLKSIIPEFEFSGKAMKIGDIFLTKKLFNQIVEVLFKMLHKEIIVINDDDDEFTKKEKEVKLKVQRIKKNSKKNSNSTKFNDIFAAIIYEFPQYKIKDLFELNIYTFYYLFEYVGKIANYEVSKIAAGNGLAKKHKYFIEN